MNLDVYQTQAYETVKLDWNHPSERHIPTLGMIGELGSVASELKKMSRDGPAYTEGRANLAEEFGDLFWYLAATASRRQIALSSLVIKGRRKKSARAIGYAHVYSALSNIALLVEAIEIETHASTAVAKRAVGEATAEALNALLDAIALEGLSLDEVLTFNLSKGDSRFGGSATGPAPCFDRGFATYEQLPRQMQIQFLQRDRGQGRVEVLLRANRMSIGDRLTDNSHVDDGYRFHDAFHFANAAVLGWSPVLRAVLRCKRKGKPSTDEVQDGARAGIVEEAIANTVFQYADSHSMLKDLKHVDHGLLQLIQRMVRGLEVEELSMRDWERAIFVGFSAFRELRKNEGGWLVLNAETRSLEYRKDGPEVD